MLFTSPFFLFILHFISFPSLLIFPSPPPPLLFSRVREFFDYLPLSNTAEIPTRETPDPIYRETPWLDTIIPSDPNKPYDIIQVSISLHSPSYLLAANLLPLSFPFPRFSPSRLLKKLLMRKNFLKLCQTTPKISSLVFQELTANLLVLLPINQWFPSLSLSPLLSPPSNAHE